MKPVKDDRGRFCSFNTVCGRNCTPVERERCRWWEHAKDEPEQKPLDLTPPTPVYKEFRTSNGHVIVSGPEAVNGCRLCGLKGPSLLNTRCSMADKHGE